MRVVRRCTKRFTHRFATVTSTSDLYTCDANVEPLYRYRPGGYHPIHIGDNLKHRYTVLQKLGWGSFSTIWAVQDLRDQRCFALKAVVAEKSGETREIDTVQAITRSDSQHPGFKHLPSLHDHFQLRGPNGTHDCLVLLMAGPSIPETVETNFRGMRLPTRLVRRLSGQIALGVACLHQQGIAHADLHTGNVVLTSASTQQFSDPAWWLGRHAQMEPVRHKCGQALASGIPRHLVRSASLPFRPPLGCSARTADFGEAFVEDGESRQSHAPLVVRAPEAIFNDRSDLRADLWSLGCLFFELATGQPPFDNIMVTPRSVIEQMIETTGEAIPLKWQPAWMAMAKNGSLTREGIRLQDWLDEAYFDSEIEAEFSRDDVQGLGRVISRLLRLEPAERASAQEILKDPWFENAEV